MKEKMMQVKKNLQKYGMKMYVATMTMVVMMAANASLAMASTDYGKNFGEWGLEQAWWLALLIIAAIFVGMLVKKNTVGMITTFFIGAVALVIIDDPSRIQTVGTAIYSIVFP